MKHKIDNIQDYYNFKTKSGLDVYFIPLKNRKNYSVTLGTKYGSRDIEFKLNNKKLKFPYGVAHYLEHKMFEQSDGVDPFHFFSKSGATTNAYTSFNSTNYQLWGTTSFNENLNHLINFVFTPYFTDENVEKERGIIKEEILMYDDEPDWVLFDAIRKCLFYNLPVKEKIAGNVKSIMNITKEDLYNCYNAFYKPSNMYLVIAGNLKFKDVKKVISENKLINKIEDKVEVEKSVYEEPDDVKSEYKKIYMDIVIPKICLGIKVNISKFNIEKVKLELYFNMIRELLFGSISDFSEYIMTNKLATGYYVENNYFDNFLDVNIYAESTRADMFIDEVKKQLNDIKITNKMFNLLKKSWISKEIISLDDIDVLGDNIVNDVVSYDKYYDNYIDIINSLNIKEMKYIVENIDLTNQSLVMILPNKN